MASKERNDHIYLRELGGILKCSSTMVECDEGDNSRNRLRLEAAKKETQFHPLLWALYPCIHEFKYYKSVIHVDEMWLYGK